MSCNCWCGCNKNATDARCRPCQDGIHNLGTVNNAI